MEPMFSGASAAMAATRSTVLGIFDKFRIHDDKMKRMFPTSFDSLSIETLCSRDLYRYWATFLCSVYMIETTTKVAATAAAAASTVITSTHLAGSSAHLYFNGLLNIANLRVTKEAPNDTAAKLFFTCRLVNGGTEEAKWLSGLRDTIRRVCFLRAVEAGDQMDFSAPPVYLDPHIIEFLKMHSLRNSKDSALRKFSILTLWLVSGRAAETSHLTFDGMTWDAALQCAFMEVPQVKTSKTKQIAFVAGSHRHNCWFLAFADYLVMKCLALWEEDAAPWLFADLEASRSPGTVLSNYLKAFFRDAEMHMPPGLSASSLRHGVCTLLSFNMLAEIAVHTTGHSLTDISALWEYVDFACKGCIPGARVLAGWPGTLTPLQIL